MGQAPEKAIRACILATRSPVTWPSPSPTSRTHIGRPCRHRLHGDHPRGGGPLRPDELGGRPVAERTDVGRTSETLAFLATVGRGAGPLARATWRRRSPRRGAASAAIQRACARSPPTRPTASGWGRRPPSARRESRTVGRERSARASERRRHRDRSEDRRAGYSSGDLRPPGWPRGGHSDGRATCRRLVRPGGGRSRSSGGSSGPGAARYRDPWRLVLDEPEPVRRIPADRLDRVAQAFGDLVDLKSTFTLGHSSRVAELAGAAAERIGLPDPGAVRRAAWFHDLGALRWRPGRGRSEAL